MRKIVIPVIAAGITVAAMAYQAKTVNPTLTEAPDVHLAEIPGFESTPFDPSEAELKTLPSDTRFDRRRYVADDGTWYQVSIVIGGRSKSSIHRPEMCLPSQGNQMTEPRTFTAAGTEWHSVTLTYGTSSSVNFAYTFFNQAGFKTCSHVRRILCDIWDRSILCRIDRWVMVTVCTSETDRHRQAEFLSKLPIPGQR